MEVYSSRFTPGVRGCDICLEIGEVVKYKLASEKIINIKIDSKRMTHDQCETYGYEAIFEDDGKRYFADGEMIVWWEGKTESPAELDNAIELINQ